LIPRFQYVGPAIATLATFALQAALVLWVAHFSKGSAPLEWTRIGGVLAAVLAAMTFAVALEARGGLASPAATVLLKIGVASAILAFLWFGVLSRTERRDVRARFARSA
jgi:O-antigen/teichoic acid export membrane protein